MIFVFDSGHHFAFSNYNFLFLIHILGSIIGNHEPHQHPVDIASVEAKIVCNKIKKRAAKNDDIPATVISSVLSTVSSPIVAKLPKIVSLTREVQHIRKTDKPQIKKTANRTELIIPDEFKKTAKGEDFSFHDSGNNKSRFLIFTTIKNLEILSECENWAGDGTFSSVPIIFKQLYTIHGLKNGKMLPLVYMLLPSKSEKVHTQCLTILKNRIPELNPNRIMVDVEPAFISAFHKVFPNTIVSGCLFHFSQCIWRNI